VLLSRMIIFLSLRNLKEMNIVGIFKLCISRKGRRFRVYDCGEVRYSQRNYIACATT
jgi:hypothetical protein